MKLDFMIIYEIKLFIHVVYFFYSFKIKKTKTILQLKNLFINILDLSNVILIFIINHLHQFIKYKTIFLLFIILLMINRI